MIDDLATAARTYFNAADNATAHGKTPEQFDMACLYSNYVRERLRNALEEYEEGQAGITAPTPLLVNNESTSLSE